MTEKSTCKVLFLGLSFFLVFSVAVGVTYWYLYSSARTSLRNTFSTIQTNAIPNVVQAR